MDRRFSKVVLIILLLCFVTQDQKPPPLKSEKSGIRKLTIQDSLYIDMLKRRDAVYNFKFYNK